MLDIRFVRKSPDVVREDLSKRGELDKIAWVDDLLKKDLEWLNLKKEVDDLRRERNTISMKINSLKKEGESVVGELKKAKSIPIKIEKIEHNMGVLKDKINHYLMRIPNILDKTVPIGKDDTENKVVRFFGKIPKFEFELKPHGEAVEDLKIAEFKKAGLVSGAGFYYLKDGLALLDLALQRFAIDFLIKKGYELVIPPLMLRRKPYEGVIDLSDFETMMYKIENEDLYLIATSEHPLVALHFNELIDEDKLPLKYVGVSPCFRKEIGSHGVDTKGVFRVHQFFKVEQVVICKPEDSFKYHEEIQKNAEELYKKLNIPFRVVNVCTGDIGIVAAKKYDTEAWFPRENCYKEVGSCSNCTSYQAVRSGIKYLKKDNNKEYVHTLNSTAIATSRAMRSIIENYQQKDGSIKIPLVLRTYMNGMDSIDLEKKKSGFKKRAKSEHKEKKEKNGKKVKSGSKRKRRV